MLPKRRQFTDVLLDLTLSSSGTPLDWNDVEIEDLYIRSDNQTAFSGCLKRNVDASDATLLHLEWDAPDQFYLGPHRVIGFVKVEGVEATFDIPAVELVSTSAEATDEDAIDLSGSVSLTGLEATLHIVGVGIPESAYATDAEVKALFPAPSDYSDDFNNDFGPLD